RRAAPLERRESSHERPHLAAHRDRVRQALELRVDTRELGLERRTRVGGGLGLELRSYAGENLVLEIRRQDLTDALEHLVVDLVHRGQMEIAAHALAAGEVARAGVEGD